MPTTYRSKHSYSMLLTLGFFAVAAHADSAAPLGLLRLKSDGKQNNPAPILATKFNVDTLVPTTGAIKGKRGSVDYLALDGGNQWVRPLIGAAKQVTFVSFHLYGSIGTVVEIGGAKLGITESDAPGYAQLMTKSGTDDWRSLRINVPFKAYGGKMLAVLPVLTVRLDPHEDTFDIYSDAQLWADNLPVVAGEKQRRFLLTSGSEGAWICGLVQSDENPLYVDSNGNGVDDQFEQRKKGRVVAEKGTRTERKQLAEEWRMEQRTRPPEALFYRGPDPDGK